MCKQILAPPISGHSSIKLLHARHPLHFRSRHILRYPPVHHALPTRASGGTRALWTRVRGSVRVYYHRLLSFERTGRMVSGIPRTISVSRYGDLRHCYLALVRHSYRAGGTFLITYTVTQLLGNLDVGRICHLHQLLQRFPQLQQMAQGLVSSLF
jgi:hypothetical protein